MILSSTDSPVAKRLQLRLLIAAVCILSAYLVLDFRLFHSGGTAIHLTDLIPRRAHSGTCASLEDFLEDATEPATPKEDPWWQMKWIGKPASCDVRGYAIERLDDAHNFRRGFSLRFISDVEDKTHLLPWLLPARRPQMREPQRRVLLDLGANSFGTSITWFMRMYPLDFTEVHAFEADPTLLRVPTDGFNEAGNVASPNHASLAVKKTPGVPTWMLRRIRTYRKFVSDRDDVPSGRMDVTRFMKEELRLRPEDTVVVKMDIEGSEWPILSRWMRDPEMPSIVDELFVEVHYNDPSMWDYHWARYGNITRRDAKRLMADLRLHGFYAHFWP